MKVSGLKNQQRYLMKKVENLSNELVDVMELLELVSQIVEQDEEKDDDLIDSDDEEEYHDDYHKKLSMALKKIIKEQDKNDYYEYKPKRTIEIETDSDDDLDVDNEIQLFGN